MNKNKRDIINLILDIESPKEVEIRTNSIVISKDYDDLYLNEIRAGISYQILIETSDTQLIDIIIREWLKHLEGRENA